MKFGVIILLVILCPALKAQELFVSTEPASNMSKGSVGLRLGSSLYQMEHDQKFESLRIAPEIMFGVNKNMMFHISAYASNMFQTKFRVEGASLYGKYRFYSNDDVHEHFRMAAYTRLAIVKNPQVLETHHQHLLPDGNGGFVAHDELIFSESNDIDLDGNSSGIAAGLVFTKLKNRVALSGSAGYTKRINNIDFDSKPYQPKAEINFTASGGYLLFPREYTSYKQVNCNIYLEILGGAFTSKSLYFIDVAPAVQFLFNSIFRVDLSYRSQLAGKISRLSNKSFFLRLEYNLLNLF